MCWEEYSSAARIFVCNSPVTSTPRSCRNNLELTATMSMSAGSRQHCPGRPGRARRTAEDPKSPGQTRETPGHARDSLERTTGLEPATLTLARCWELRIQALSRADAPFDSKYGRNGAARWAVIVRPYPVPSQWRGRGAPSSVFRLSPGVLPGPRRRRAWSAPLCPLAEPVVVPGRREPGALARHEGALAQAGAEVLGSGIGDHIA